MRRGLVVFSRQLKPIPCLKVFKNVSCAVLNWRNRYWLGDPRGDLKKLFRCCGKGPCVVWSRSVCFYGTLRSLKVSLDGDLDIWNYYIGNNGRELSCCLTFYSGDNTSMSVFLLRQKRKKRRMVCFKGPRRFQPHNTVSC